MHTTETGRDELTTNDVAEYIADECAPRYGQTVTGYGSKIPTRYRLRLNDDGRIRRVYVDAYGNGGGTPYVIVRGEVAYLSTDVEHTLSR